jgi:hypothetical protein
MAIVRAHVRHLQNIVRLERLQSRTTGVVHFRSIVGVKVGVQCAAAVSLIEFKSYRHVPIVWIGICTLEEFYILYEVKAHPEVLQHKAQQDVTYRKYKPAEPAAAICL